MKMPVAKLWWTTRAVHSMVLCLLILELIIWRTGQREGGGICPATLCFYFHGFQLMFHLGLQWTAGRINLFKNVILKMIIIKGLYVKGYCSPFSHLATFSRVLPSNFPSPCSHTCSHSLCLCFCVFLYVHDRYSHDSFTDSWCLSPQLSHRQIMGIPYPTIFNTLLILLLCVNKLWCMHAVVCAHPLVLTGRLHEPEVTTHKSESVTLQGSPSPSPSLSLFLFLSSISFCSWRLHRGNVTQYLLLHLLAACDSCTYFWNTACLMQLPVCTAC